MTTFAFNCLSMQSIQATVAPKTQRLMSYVVCWSLRMKMTQKLPQFTLPEHSIAHLQ